MDFNLTDDQSQLQQAVRRFAQAELPVVARQLEAEGEPLSKEWTKRYAQMGYLGVNLPTEYGGQGLGHLEAVLVLEELAKVSGAVGGPVFESCFGPTLAILRYGSETLKRRVLPAVCAGEKIVAISMSEPDAGSALTDLKTRGTIEGGEVVLNGCKRWCSGAGHADGYLVYCRLSDDPGVKAIGAVYVERGTADMSFGKRGRTMGFRSAYQSDIFFDGCRVPVENIVVPAGGFAKLMAAFDLERCGNTTMSLAVAQGAFDQVVQYVQERKQFGRPIVEFQAVQLKIAEMAMKLDAARLLLYRAVCNAGNGLPSVRESSIAKCFANEITREVCGASLQLMGGYGYSSEFDLEQRFRDSWGWGIAGGTIDIQKINIASAVVGKRFDQR